MAKATLQEGQDLVLLLYGGNYYMRITSASPVTPFFLHGSQISGVNVDECESSKSQEVTLSDTEQILDSSNNA
jgi:hypothetical protein